MGMVEARVAVSELLGDIIELPAVFEANLLCPECLKVGSLIIAGSHYYCRNCYFSCWVGVALTKQGQDWLMLSDSLRRK